MHENGCVLICRHQTQTCYLFYDVFISLSLFCFHFHFHFHHCHHVLICQHQTETCYLFYDFLFYFHFLVFTSIFTFTFIIVIMSSSGNRHQTETCYLFYGPKNSTLSPHLHRALAGGGGEAKTKGGYCAWGALCVSSITRMSLFRCQNWKTMGETYIFWLLWVLS